MHDKSFLQWGKIYVVDSEQGAMIKRLCYDPSSDDIVLLKSDNPDYANPKSAHFHSSSEASKLSTNSIK